PADVTWPDVGRSSPPNRFNNVDFPEPDFPNNATRSPRGISSEMLRKAKIGADAVPYCLETSIKRTDTGFSSVDTTCHYREGQGTCDRTAIDKTAGVRIKNYAASRCFKPPCLYRNMPASVWTSL